MPTKKTKVVVMGGGTGTFPVITALKQIGADISAIIAVSDSGGSSGKIRDEFGFEPVGDLRQSLTALSSDKGQEWIRKILLYRFDKGTGLVGHNLGNLILTALQDMTKNTTKAVEIAEKIFRLEGSIIPVTTQPTDLHIHYTDGTTVVGEHILDEKVTHPKKIQSISLVPESTLNPKAFAAIVEADHIFIGPGDHYASILATLAVNDIPRAFSKTKAEVTYFLNLMTRYSQTHNMTAQDHVQEIESAIKKPVTRIILNNTIPQKKALELYKAQEEYPVVQNLGSDARVLSADLLLDEIIQTAKQDAVQRSLIRHDPNKIAHILQQIL